MDYLKEVFKDNPIIIFFVAAWGFFVSHVSMSGITGFLSLMLTTIYVLIALLRLIDEIRERIERLKK